MQIARNQTQGLTYAQHPELHPSTGPLISLVCENRNANTAPPRLVFSTGTTAMLSAQPTFQSELPEHAGPVTLICITTVQGLRRSSGKHLTSTHNLECSNRTEFSLCPWLSFPSLLGKRLPFFNVILFILTDSCSEAILIQTDVKFSTVHADDNLG